MELDKKFIPLSNAYSNRLDNFINTSKKKDIISRCQTRNATSPQLSNIGRNGVAAHFKRGEGMENRNRDMSKVCFFDQRIIKYN